MSPHPFALVALSLPGVTAKAILDTQVFRVRQTTFATLGWPEPGWAVIKLSLGDQKRLLAQSSALAAEPGPRGKQGVTLMRLDAASEALVAETLRAAWSRLDGGRRRAAAQLVGGAALSR